MNCLINKDHLLHGQYHYPDIPNKPPRNDMISNEFIVLIPIFSDDWEKTFDRNKPYDQQIILSYLQSALWARYCWLTNSDAMCYGVDVRIYVEDILEDIVRDKIESTHHNWDTDVFTFSVPPLKSKTENARGSWGRLAKDLCPIMDKRLKDYAETIIVADADHFVCRKPLTLPFFKNLRDAKQNIKNKIGFLQVSNWQSHSGKSSMVEEWRSKGYIARGYKAEYESILQNMFEDLGEKDFVSKLILDGLWIYPRTWFEENLPEFIEWVRSNVPIIGDSEAAMTIALNIFDELEVYDITMQFGYNWMICSQNAIEKTPEEHLKNLDFLHGHVSEKSTPTLFNYLREYDNEIY